MSEFSEWLNKNNYEITNHKSGCDICEIKGVNGGARKLLKVMSVNNLDKEAVKEVVDTMNRINNLNMNGLMKYRIIESDGNVLYRVMRRYKVHLDEIDPVKYFEEDGPFNILNGILDILKSLDENGTFHSDLKPSNIFLNDENEVVITDYCQNILYKGREGRKIDGKRDNLCFVSVDELTGKEIDKSSDIWNFGLIYYYIKSGKYPFVGSNMLETIENIRDVKYIPLEGEFNLQLNIFFNRTICKDKSRRYELNKVIEELKKLNEDKLPVAPLEDEVLNVIEWMEYRDDLIEIYNNKPNEEIISILLTMKLFKEDTSIYNKLNEGNSLDMKIFNINTPYNDKEIVTIYSSSIYFSEEGIEYFFRMMKRINPSKLKFYDGFSIPEKYQSIFISKITEFPNLQELDLSSCYLAFKFVELFVKSIPHMLKLKYVNISNNLVGPEGFKLLLPHLNLLISEENVLNIMGMNLNDESMMLLSEALHKYPNLEKLYINNNKNIHSVGLKELFSKFPISKVEFDFNGSKELLIDKVIQELLKYIKSNNGLYFSNLEIDDDFFKLFISLRSNEMKEIKRLDLSNNKLTYKSVEILINNLSSLSSLKELLLYENEIGDKGMKLLSPHIDLLIDDDKCINCSKMRLTSNGLKYALDGLKNVKYNFKLDLHDNNINSHGINDLMNYIQENNNIKKLLIHDNPICNVGFELLLSKLDMIMVEKIENMSNISIDDESVILLSKKMYLVDYFCKTINLNGNNISGKGLKAICSKSLEKEYYPFIQMNCSSWSDEESKYYSDYCMIKRKIEIFE